MAFVTDTPLAHRYPAPSPKAVLNRLFTWSAVARERRALAEMDASRLADIGLTTKTARREAAKPFWLTRR